jgi:HSP90 family molecular chaperone
MEKSRIFTKDISLKVGDYLKEADSKYSNSYRIYKVTKIEGNYMRMDISIEYSRGKKVPKLRTINIGADIDAHHYVKGDKYKTYYLGSKNAYSLLYGN